MLRSIVRAVLSRPDGRLTTYHDRRKIAALLSFIPIPLPNLLSLFGSDKQRSGQHNYGEAYQRVLRSRRYRRLKILEIGVLTGDSILAWRAYFPRAVTIGLDIDDKSGLAAGQRTRIYRGDQGSAADLRRICEAEGPFDIVIDDGSHLSRHQLFSFRMLFPKLRGDGLYVIEDVQTSFWTGMVLGSQWDGRRISDPAFAQTCFGWFLDLAKYLNHAEFETSEGTDEEKVELGQQIRRISFEHNMIVVEKGVNTNPSNVLQND